MVKTQIQLTEEQYEVLKRISQTNNISLSEIIRRSIDYNLNYTLSIKNEDKIDRAKKVAGQYGSGRKDLSEKHDEYLAEGYK